MARISATFSVSLPPEMADELERVRRKEHRSRSELVREALRRYMREAEIHAMRDRIARLPEAPPSAEDLVAIEEGGRELGEGKFVSLDELRHDLVRRRQQSRAKKSRSRARR
jgi:Arc/MetJ-type ribon-helix-helix transcriptional regulator